MASSHEQGARFPSQPWHEYTSSRIQLIACVYLDHGLSQTLAFEAIARKARLVGNPFLIDVFVHSGHDTEHLWVKGAVQYSEEKMSYLSSSVRDDNITSQTIHDINALRLSGLPRTSHEGIRFARQCPNLSRCAR